VDTAQYSRRLRLTVLGTGVNAGLALSSAGCADFQLSTTAPDVSTETTAIYTCTVTAVGEQTVSVARSSDNAVLATVPFTVPVPQVTMAIDNGAGTSGTLVITLTPVQTPITVNNFLNYVNAGFYDGTVFHRHATNFVLQGGGFAAPLVATAPPPALKPTNPPIVLEVGRGLSNTALTLAMARTAVLNSATSQFFINLGNNAFLDTSGGGYAVFGSITSGAELVTAMRSAPCTLWPLGPVAAGDCLPVPNLVITSARQTR
jgi:cyclophilin family peptidyl-prolyl cis-trans isomerase